MNIRTVWRVILALSVLLPAAAFGQSRAGPAALSAAATTTCAAPLTTSFLALVVQPYTGAASFNIGANASGNTVSFFASGDGRTTWSALNVTASNSTSAVTTSTSANIVYQANVAGYTDVCAEISTLSGGTTTVTINLGEQAARANGGGGSTSPGGSSGQVQFNNGGAFGGVAGSAVTAATGAIGLTQPASSGNVVLTITPGATETHEATYFGSPFSDYAAAAQAILPSASFRPMSYFSNVQDNTGDLFGGAMFAAQDGSATNTLQAITAAAFATNTAPKPGPTVAGVFQSFQLGNGGYSGPEALFGVATLAENLASSGTLPFIAGIQSTAQNGGAGSVTLQAGVIAETNSNAGGGTVARNVGVYAGSQAGVGTTNYGFYGEDQGTAAGAYAQWMNGGRTVFNEAGSSTNYGQVTISGTGIDTDPTTLEPMLLELTSETSVIGQLVMHVQDGTAGNVDEFAFYKTGPIVQEGHFVGDAGNQAYTITDTTNGFSWASFGGTAATLSLAGLYHPVSLAIGAGSPTVTAFQGTDTKALTSGTVTGTGATLCADANGGATTSGCAVTAVVNHSGSAQTNVHIVQDTCTLGTSCSITLTGSAVFTSSSSYTCLTQDDTGIYATQCAQSSGSALVITGNSTDVIRYVLIGN